MRHNFVTTQRKTFVALGANLQLSCSTPAETLTKALDRLHDSPLEVTAKSRLFKTPCFPAGAGPDYVNSVVQLEGDLQPGQVLALLHAIEAEFGRHRVQRWGSRTLDLDLLALDDAVLPDRNTFERWHDLPVVEQPKTAPDQLILPHPRMHERAFVLVPMLDIAPDWPHPVLGVTVREMVAALPKADVEAVIPL
ncbi:2-amino-4-hydroxy-6-hydroxymethyldihydropteridine diphosphokinase [Pseudoruegeria sp. HB172150]|uniref:2-amino-4-hydroxy-6- hydroxymethyldihydropteridine diphosphokinase n=1 Tax=Pseudoruegeria sp. HB172150 TaxID=2721164 RepID=UPI00155253B1|nr:2-amino-4-hydroxy-6-hydroxymethyldihydropteridine diphosphokinase [Pseudoruegeria sp. HB172150]